MQALRNLAGYAKLLNARYRAKGWLAAFFGTAATGTTFWELYDAPNKVDSWGKAATVMAAVCAVIAAVWDSMKSEIEGKYTLGLALAHGYYQSLVRPVLESDPNARLVVYRPSRLDELDAAAVASRIKDLQDAGRTVSEAHLPGREGSRTLWRVDGGNGPGAYVDFPRTLNTLQSLLDYRDRQYKATTGSFFTSEHRALVTKLLIDEFFEELEKMLALDELHGDDRVDFTDSLQSKT